MSHQDFDLIKDQYVEEISGHARLWRHKQTGAEVLSVRNNDENKCFGVTLRTPPPDSSGVAHILEHSVLCGSEKFPVREPFVELLKGSLQTFLNAFTFPDKTCYPVASTNLQDFYNLVDVYIDAVFHPRISEDIFRQEGWHVEADSPDEAWAYKGVVYNEMKGAYSTPDSILAEQSQQSMFPDMLYSLDSGGDPEAILSLSFQNFKNFHSTLYHPSNARFFFWGDDPEEKRLDILAKELARYTNNPVNSAIPLQARRDMPLHIEVPYAAGEDEDRALFTINWLLCETADIGTAMTLEILEHILEGLPGSPLRKALIESGLGEDLTGIGLESDLRQMYYSVGLKGLDPQDLPEAEMLIHETLAALAEEGIDPEAVEAAVNSVEFELRENNSGRFPRGLSAMVQSLSTWLYGGDPLAPLAWEAPLAQIKERLAKGEKLFEESLRHWFLDNQHRSTVVLLPDTGLAQAREERERDRLARVQAACSSEERQALVAETLRLRAAQESPDSPEALATIPCLTTADLPLRNTLLPLEKIHTGPDKAHTFLLHDLDTKGVAYLSLLLPLQGVPQHLLPLVPLLGRALTEMGTGKRDFVRLGMRIAAKTGGVWADPFFCTRKEDQSPLAYLCVGGKAVRDKVSDLFDILHEVLLDPSFDQRERFCQMLLESKARLEHGLVASGHGAVSVRLRARYSLTGWLEEMTGGISYLHFVRALAHRAEHDWPSVLADLQDLYTRIVRSPNAVADCTADAATGAAVEQGVAALLAALPSTPAPDKATWACPVLPSAEVFTAPAQVNFVGKGANLYQLGYRYHGSAQVIFRYLRMGYLWEKVRVQGGAYGAFCAMDRLSGTLVQASYRDPNVLSTLETYDAAAAYLRSFRPNAREISSAIVGAIGDLDTYMLPDAKGAASLTRHLVGDSDEARQSMRDEILSTTGQHFRDFADMMEEVASKGSVCVLGGSTAEAAAASQGWSTEKLL